MPGVLESAGAAIQATSAAPLHTNEFFTGLWTNGSPLGPGPVPFMYAKYYGATRYDRLIDGNDTEISPRLTLIRRPGHTVYNPGPFPPINRFFEFRGFTLTDEIIHLLADCDPGTGSASGTVREVTQPATNSILWAKDPAAGKTSFVSVGNILYAGDGHDTHQWITSAQSWVANTFYQAGSFIIDPNGNIQESMGNQTATLINILIEAKSSGYKQVTLFFSPTTPIEIGVGVYVVMAGLTTVPQLNGQKYGTNQVVSQTQVSFLTNDSTVPVTPYSAETGTAKDYQGTGTSGATPPAWNPTNGGATEDGGMVWVNTGTAAQSWGGQGPTTAPVVTTTSPPSVHPNWAASTWYSPSFVIVDSNNNMQALIQDGTTASSTPSWSTTLNGITNDGACKWQMIGTKNWQASHAYTLDQTVVVAYSYYILVPVKVNIDGTWVTYYQQQVVNATSVFQVQQAGTSGPAQPTWNNGLNTTTVDGTVTWHNIGPTSSTGPPYPGPSAQNLSLAIKVIDANGYIETATMQGKTGAAAPTWNTSPGATTTDLNQVWRNDGAFAVAATEPWYWAYSGKNSITGDISNASPLSAPLIPATGQIPVIQGQGLPEPPWDTIILWRTAAGGSTLLYDDEFPNPGPGQTWIYTDTNLDPGTASSGSSSGMLNPFITAPIDHQNDPPPSNFLPEAYYLGRIWGYTNNILRWTGGPDTTTGNGNSTMPPVNQFPFPSKGVICWPTSVGLICFTTTDIWAVLGQGTDQSPFYVVNFQQGIGVASSDAFGVNGSTAYVMLTSHQVVSIDPGAGELEVGFPIADVFDNYMDPRLSYITWHQGRSADTALYVANGSNFWYRMAAVSAPESGNVWSTAASLRNPGKVRAMISAEITPGEKVLLLGPHVDGNPILQRDSSVHSDNGVAYPSVAVIAPIVLSQPGSTAGVQFAVTEEKLIDGASPIVVKMLFDEIIDFVHTHTADWRQLRNISNDPPNLPKQKSFLTQRLWAQQDPSTVIKCRFYEQQVSWPAEDFANELYTNTVFGRLPEKARK